MSDIDLTTTALTDRDLDAVAGGWGVLAGMIAAMNPAPTAHPSCETVMALTGGTPERDCPHPQ
jgi:hypothetical protein